MHMARFDVKFPPGSAVTKQHVAQLHNDYERQIGRVNQFADQFHKRFSRCQSIAAIIDLVKRPLTVDPQEA